MGKRRSVSSRKFCVLSGCFPTSGTWVRFCMPILLLLSRSLSEIPHPLSAVFLWLLLSFNLIAARMLTMLTMSFVILHHNTATSESLWGESLCQKCTQSIWANKEPLWIPAQCGISQSKEVLIPAKGADEIMCGHSFQAIQVTGKPPKLSFRYALSTHLKASHLHEWVMWTIMKAIFHCS